MPALSLPKGPSPNPPWGRNTRPSPALPQDTQLEGTSDDDLRPGRTFGEGSGHPIHQPRVRRQS